MNKLFAVGVEIEDQGAIGVIIELENGEQTKASKYLGGSSSGADLAIDALKWGLELAKNMGLQQIEVHTNAPIINIRYIEEREMVKPAGSKPRVIKGSMIAPTRHFDLTSFQVEQMLRSDFSSVVMLFDEENPIHNETAELATRALNKVKEQ